ncbi:MAG: DNA replication/repair protein RecF [Clostridia bacterium]|nr:DNA replication/repair protein RecF [Clostridia bacterium]
MICQSASYTDFRNIQSADIRFCDGINIIFGDNAVGKTSAIEGIYLCALGRSHRTSKEKDFIRFGEEAARVSIVYEDSTRQNELAIAWSQRGRKQCAKNGVLIRKMSEFIGNFRAVLFTPEHLSIIKDGPAERRGFLDNAISQLDRVYVASLQRYHTVLQQRNKLLQDCMKDPGLIPTVDIWSQQLAEEAAVISKKREEYVRSCEEYVKTIFHDMTSGREIPEMVYTGARDAAWFYSKLTENVQREILYGSTLYGTHKDDVTVFINGKEARSFASQGQQRSLSLAMKLAEGEIAKDLTGEYPVFLFDDVLSELDDSRKEYVMQGLSHRQVIMTTCETDVLPKNSYRINVKDGIFRYVP